METRTRHYLKELKKILRHYKARTTVKCISKENNSFRITIKHSYMTSLPNRIKDWIEYVIYKIDKFLIPDPTNIMFAPIHVKHSCSPICEVDLEIRLSENDFEIFEEYLGSTYTAYDVRKRY